MSLSGGAELGLHVEEQIFRSLGHHRRIVSFKGKHEDGLLLEYMPNGSVVNFVQNANPSPSMKERLKWASQAAEAVAYIYEKGVLHCDISVSNLLLDTDLNIKLYDFQGRLLYADGSIRLNGESAILNSFSLEGYRDVKLLYLIGKGSDGVVSEQ